MKAIVATGFGKLHFHETARALAGAGVEVNFLTGWVPKHNQSAPGGASGKVSGRKAPGGAHGGPADWDPGAPSPRWPGSRSPDLIKLIQRTRVIPLDLAYGMEFRLAAWGSRKYLKDADVLLVRSGAGQSGAIRKARRNGLAMVTDHSIAHPAFMHGPCVKSLPVSVCPPATTRERTCGSWCCVIATMPTCCWSTPTS